MTMLDRHSNAAHDQDGGRLVALRPATAEDTGFLDAVFASTRAEEMALVDWTSGQNAAFLRMQADLQRRSYRTQFPLAQDQVILHGGIPAGRIMVDRSGGALLLIDLALLPEHRDAGIGTALIRDLQTEATSAGKPVRLHVEPGNPARRLYERLGFEEIGTHVLYAAMEWRPDAAGASDPHAERPTAEVNR